jgi:hypothetical protein
LTSPPATAGQSTFLPASPSASAANLCASRYAGPSKTAFGSLTRQLRSLERRENDSSDWARRAKSSRSCPFSIETLTTRLRPSACKPHPEHAATRQFSSARIRHHLSLRSSQCNRRPDGPSVFPCGAPLSGFSWPQLSLKNRLKWPRRDHQRSRFRCSRSNVSLSISSPSGPSII